MKTSRSLTLLLAATGTLLGVGAAPTSSAQDNAAGNGKLPALSTAEQDYLKAVVAENLGEMDLGYLAIEKATNDAVKRHGRDLVDTHTKTMKEVLEMASRHNVFLPIRPDLSAYEKLQNVGGADFDRAYAAEAQRLNQQAVDQLNGLMGQLTSDDVKSFAKRDLDDDKEHLKGAQDLAAKLGGS